MSSETVKRLEAYGATANGTRLHIIRETYSGCTRGWCGTILALRRGVWSNPTADQVVCRRCLHNQAAQPTARSEPTIEGES